MDITGIVLAAGQSKRQGGTRPLLVHETAAIIERVLENFRAAKLQSLILVLGHEARKVLQKLSVGGMKVIINPTPSLGISASLQRGMAHLPPHCEALMVVLGDMPLIETKTVDRIIDAFSKSKKGIAVPVCDGQPGYPVILDLDKYRDALLALRGDVGVREILASNPDDILEVKIQSDEVLIDIDTHEDLENLRDRLDMPREVSSYA